MIVLFCSYLCFRDKENSVEKLGEKERVNIYMETEIERKKQRKRETDGQKEKEGKRVDINMKTDIEREGGTDIQKKRLRVKKRRRGLEIVTPIIRSRLFYLYNNFLGSTLGLEIHFKICNYRIHRQ